MNNVYLDTETTGLKVEDEHRIVEVAAVACVDRKIAPEHFQGHFNPEREMDQGAVRIHGLTNEFLEDKPKFADRADELIQFIRGSRLYIHNAKFDEEFLNMELERIGKPKLGDLVEGIVDTLVLARRQFPLGGNSLDRLCTRFGIDNSQRQKHGALLDATLLAEVHLAMTRGQISIGGLATHSQDDTSTHGNQFAGGLGDVPIKVIGANEEERSAHNEWIGELCGGSNTDLKEVSDER